MSPRGIARRIAAMEVSEGAGVTVRRSIGLPALRHLDPFLMLDHFSSDDPDDYIAGFPDHPHRGFVTLTYMLDGHMEHRDSMGNHGDLRSGGAQWMQAGSGVIHSEMPRQSDGLMRGFQLWINLPAREKMSDPAYQEFSAADIPLVDLPGQQVRVLSGTYGDARGPVHDPHTGVHYLDVTLGARESFRNQADVADAGFAYFFEGDGRIGEQPMAPHQLAVLSPGDVVEVNAGAHGARFLLVTGRPLGEPVVQHGPFVMNSREEIEQALADYRDGRLVRQGASVTG
jgi:redox-sensitive bicupin YhaK (pirin superfamily)